MKASDMRKVDIQDKGIEVLNTVLAGLTKQEIYKIMKAISAHIKNKGGE